MNKKSLAIFIIGLAVLFFIVITRIDNKSESILPEGSNKSTVIIPNQGGAMEGHTPRGFKGIGTGLFVGDNLNPGFPEEDGVQMFLTFDLSGISGAKVSSAYLQSNAKNTEVQGTPFKDLGDLVVEAVLYDEFSADLWNIDSSGEVCRLVISRENIYECDVSSFIQDSLVSGASNAQFRVRFEKAGDGDGKQDMLFFYNVNSNTNEPGLFKLNISTGNTETGIKKENPITNIQVPIVAYLVKDSNESSTERDEEAVKLLLGNSQKIWDQADIVLDVSIKEIMLSEDLTDSVASGNFRELYSILPRDNRAFNIFYVSDLLGPNGIALAPAVALVADITTVDDFRATAHEIGHLLGLNHTLDSRSRLMFPGANGRELSDDEVSLARNGAMLLNELFTLYLNQ